MKNINKYKQIFLEEFHLDNEGEVRRSKDGYHNRFKKGDLAKFFCNATGYQCIQIPRVRRVVQKSNLVWLLANGEIPQGKEIDHIDGNVLNNHISNLRLVDRAKNSKNRKKRSDNTSGITGIRWDEGKQRYIIRKTINGKRKATSRKTLEEAELALQQFTDADGDYTYRHGK